MAGSRWSDIIGSSLQGREGEDAAWKRRITLRIGRSLGAARDEVYAVDLNSMGGGGGGGN